VNVLLVNPPSPQPINRRFRCTYRARHFLFPPVELLLLGGVARRVKGVRATLLDAVAEGLDEGATLERARQAVPELVVYLAGNDTLAGDVALGRRLAQSLAGRPVLVAGYLPSLYPAEVLEAGAGHGVLTGEPEPAFQALLERLAGDWSAWPEILGDLAGVVTARAAGAGRAEGDQDRPVLVEGLLPPGGPLEEDLDWLPTPDYGLARSSAYRDFFLPRPFAVLQTSRGCPFGCTYCVKPHGRRMRYRSVGRVLEDVERLVVDHGIRTVRFEDDMFTLRPERVEALCEGLLALRRRPVWSCLSRPDTLDPVLPRLMARAGCVRVYLGIETGSPRVWSELDRGGEPDPRVAVRALSAAGIEAAGFFLVGLPSESEEEFASTVRLARELELDDLAVSTVRPYPGTGLFARERENVTFNLMPFESRFADPKAAARARSRERALYRAFYLRSRTAVRLLRRAWRAPGPVLGDSLALARSLLAELFTRERVREDLL
jgi:radical SAM superfamily enzyme YgiQ (UPF0313 family)